MKILYGKDKYFMGVVKFFDANKDFGFIASNNCNMPTPKYYQDFYVNSVSFMEDDAKKERSVVVFQVERQENGKKRAINVRGISQTDEDVHLALSYYGDHEYILFNNDRKFNLFISTHTPLKFVADKVQYIIVNDDERSPMRTVNHFKFFVDHYTLEQFTNVEKAVWVSFFSVLTNDECLEILKLYPFTCRYFTDTILLNNWLDIYFNDNISLEEIKQLMNNYDFLPEECVCAARERIQNIVDEKIRNLYLQLSLKDDINENDIDAQPTYSRIGYAINHSHSKSLLRDLHAYLRISHNDYTEERNKCLKSIRYNKFITALNKYVAQRTGNYSTKELYNSYNTIEGDKERCIPALKRVSQSLIEHDIEDENFGHAISFLILVSKFDTNFVLPYRERLCGPIHKSLHKKLVDSLSSPNSLRNTFFTCFDSWTSIFDNHEKNLLKEEFGAIMLQQSSVFSLSVCSEFEYGWLPVEKVLNRVSEIISGWTYTDFATFIDNADKLFGNHISYNDLIVRKSLSLIHDIPINKSFSKEEKTTSDALTIQRRNCSFLNKVKSVVENSSSSSKEMWNNYINTRSSEERIILYNNNVISDLPESVISDIVNRISLNDVRAESNRWYNKPELGNQYYKKILSETMVDLFPIILARLASLQLNEETMPLAVLLTELMTINKPSSDDYIACRNWDASFSKQLQKARDSQAGNVKLCILLWAVHFRSTAPMSRLKDTFTLFPPYLQIRVVKKLFQLVSQGRLTQTAEGLYNLIASDNNKICFPLEIAFAYLKRREKDPSATLDNDIMLGLLDGREDHPEWIDIRQLITECHGRWKVRELPDDRSNSRRGSFFNGIIKEEQSNKLIVYVPYKMVDELGNIQNYNNKYFNNIQELIKISYDNSEYQKTTVQNGITYTFNQSEKIYLYSVARAYNLKYNRLDNYVDFEKKENEDDVFCECREADALDNWFGISFYWCGNQPCFRQPIRYMLDSEWERYTILDFIRILHIPTNYTNQKGKVTKFGHYIMLSAFLKGFAKFYEHLKCRECGKLMRPMSITNFAYHAVNQFQCPDEKCSGHETIVYLNHCFNTQKCNATIDSRDSEKCPNGHFICPECGACCSTENSQRRINNLQKTGGNIPIELVVFVQNKLGHWEKNELFCFKCGKSLKEKPVDVYTCPYCKTRLKYS